MKIDYDMYAKAKAESKLITETATKLEFLSTMMTQRVVSEKDIRSDFEDKQLKAIKNALAQIYLVLELQNIDSVFDEIFNKDFDPKE